MSQPPPGWYSDPWDPSTSRYWDGAIWTPQQSAPTVAPQPGYGTQTVPSDPLLTAPDGTSWNTIWIWLIVVLPVIPAILLLFVPWRDLFDFGGLDPTEMAMEQYSLYLSPAYLLATVLGFAIYGACVFFAYRDHQLLTARGVPKPFHWAWAFISPVYPIGRSVVAKRRIGSGLAPIWVVVATMIVSVAISLYITIVVVSATFESVRQVMP